MYLFSHIWKSFVRNARWRRNLITRILYAFVGFNFIFLFLTFGYDFSSTLAKEGGEAAGRFHEWILWYLFADYLVRCISQPVPSMEVIPYLRFRIRRRKLANNLIVRSYFSLYNILPLFLITPFAVMVTGPSQGTVAALLFLAGCILFIMMNNILALVTGMLTRINPLYWILPVGIATAIALLNSLTCPLKDLSRALGESISDGRLLPFVITIGLIALIINLISRLLHRYLVVDNAGKATHMMEMGPSFARRFNHLGNAGRYMSLEISMLLRNKRPRNTLLMVPFFMVYAVSYFLFFDEMQGRFFTIIITTMFLGLGAMSYGQLLFSWESSYFDGIMARKNDLYNYIKAKFYLQVLLTLITFIPLVVVIAVSGKVNMFLLAALLLFTLGPNSFIVMMLATINDARIDLNASTFMNYQGMKGSQFIMTLLFVLIPAGIYELIRGVAGENPAIISLAFLGIIFLTSSNWWIRKVIVGSFISHKYKCLEGYRKLSA